MRRFLSALVLLSIATAAQAQDRAERLLDELTTAAGVSGHEDQVRRIMLREFRAAGADATTDGLGSAIGTLKGPEGAPKIMLAAHMDEVGLLVKYIADDGFVRFLTIGGWLDQALVDKKWLIHGAHGPVPAVSGIKTVHISRTEDRTKVFSRDELFLDAGARSKEEAEALGIRPGDPVTPAVAFTKLGKGMYAAKAFDDRLGCAVMLEAMRRIASMPHPNTIVAVGTVQEEVGLRGARTSAQTVRPDVGIAVEVGVAGDFPGVGKDQAQEKLGGGPGIFLHDGSMMPNRSLVELIRAVAADKKIPLQSEILSGYSQDASEIQRWSTGTPAVNFTVPVRYLHAFHGVIARDDFDRAVDLLVAVLMRLDAKTVQSLKSFE